MARRFDHTSTQIRINMSDCEFPSGRATVIRSKLVAKEVPKLKRLSRGPLNNHSLDNDVARIESRTNRSNGLGSWRAGLESPFSNMARLEYEITSRGTTWVTDDGLQSSGLKHANDYSEKIIARGPQLWVIDFTEISEIQMYAEMHGYLYSQRGTHFTMGYDDVALVLIEQHRFDYDMMPLLSNCLTDDRFWLINAHGNEHCDKFSLCQFLYATAKQLNSRYLIDRVMQHELMWTFADLPECKFLFRTRTHEWQFKKTHASHRVPMVENDRIILHCELSETLAPLDLNTVSTGLWYLKPIEYECYSVHSLMDNVVASFESETDVGGKLNLLLLNTAVADIKLARGQPIAYIEKRISATPAVKIY